MITWTLFAAGNAGTPAWAWARTGSQQSFAALPSTTGRPTAWLAGAAQGTSFHLFAVGNGGEVAHTRLEGGSFQQGWNDLTTVLAPPGPIARIGCAGDPDELHVFAVTRDGRLWHTRRASSGEWKQAWGDVGNALKSPLRFRAVAAAADGNTTHLLATDVDGRVWHTMRAPGGKWLQGFGEVTGVLGKPWPLREVTCGFGGGSLHVVALGDNGHPCWGERRSSGWTHNAWADLGSDAAFPGPMGAVHLQHDQVPLLTCLGRDGRISLWGRDINDSAARWFPVTLPSAGLAGGTLVADLDRRLSQKDAIIALFRAVQPLFGPSQYHF